MRPGYRIQGERKNGECHPFPSLHIERIRSSKKDLDINDDVNISAVTNSRLRTECEEGKAYPVNEKDALHSGLSVPSSDMIGMTT